MRLSIVIPVYNSAAVLERLTDQISKTFEPMVTRPSTEKLMPSDNFDTIGITCINAEISDFEILLVDDGSTDNSYEVIRGLSDRDPRLRGFRLTKNFGQQNATLCGLRHATGDLIATMDDDMQHPASALKVMIEQLFAEDRDIVYGIYPYQGERIRTMGSSLRDWLFNTQIGKPSDIEISSFRVMRRSVRDRVAQTSYRFAYISALVLRETLNIGNCQVERQPRAAGRSGYTFASLCKLYLRTWLYYGRRSIVPERLKSGPAYKLAAQTRFPEILRTESRLSQPKLLMLLGAGKLQVNAVKRAQELGFEVLAVDWEPGAPAKKISEKAGLADVFDADACLKLAEAHSADGVMTTGTDQPVLTAAMVAQGLGLPSLISVDTALGATHKGVMKRTLEAHGIPTAPYKLWQPEDGLEDLKALMPGVVKPVDSQGQRGIFRVETPLEAAARFPEVLKYSRDERILVEKFIDGDEVTFSGWVRSGRLYPLALTDRVTFSEKERIGICTAHEFPTKHFDTHGDEVLALSERIVSAFGIQEGPVYIQFLLGKAQTVVNELACRIGGAYEEIWIPVVTGCDWLRWMIEGAMGVESDFSALETYDWKKVDKRLSAQLFFSEPGIVAGLSASPSENCLDYGFHFEVGDRIGGITNATQRAGYFLVTAKDEAGLGRAVQEMYSRIRIQMEGMDRNAVMVRPRREA
ncbi:glycosyltransferase [Acidaminobacter hydrogenoformans]|uniref:Glycosyltransferase involved in cell wall bisynthesis n=1 Tax=Acidaminobacter hydrogenoformans DSM 2784 TaxID=1120920 RepID=A0A1G5S106_9FIRM|nr:glycosyltransferase [Acidaminobacter hydrogenoformans]SCZ79421.1 Glycosyltransferase involved in cell wall bisynthesis [Acidaminobacter hydrogenoformans DSM 2784]